MPRLNLVMRIIVIAIVSIAVQLVLPWWWTAVIAAFLIELSFGKGDRLGFFSGFYGIAIPWMIIAAYIDHHNDSVLAHRVLELLKLPRFGVVLIIVTGLVGGLAGGLATLSASWILGYLRNDR